MNKIPKIMYLYTDSFKHLKKMSDESLGRLIKALMDYAETGSAPDLSDDLALDMVFGMMSDQLDRDFEKHAQTCERRSRSAKHAAEARWRREKEKQCETHADACAECQEEEKEEYEKEEEKEYEKENEYENKYENESNDDAQSADRGLARSTDFDDDQNPYDPSEMGYSDKEDYDGRFDGELEQIIYYLNRSAGSCYRPETFCSRELVLDRLKEGYTVDDFKTVIDKTYMRLHKRGYKKKSIMNLMFGICFKSFLTMTDVSC